MPGLDVRIPVVVVNGAAPGPRLAVTAGLHGAEYPCIEAAIRFSRVLNPAEMAGSVVVVPVCNPPSFVARRALVNPMDNKNMNRVFPGNPEGTATDKMAYALFETVIRPSNALADLHGGDLAEDLMPYSLYLETGDAKVTEASRDMAVAFGIPYVVPSPTKGTSSSTAATMGIPAIVAEAGAAGQLGEGDVALLVRGLARLVRHFGIAPSLRVAEDREGPEPKVLSKLVRVNSEWSGMFYRTKHAGERVKAGEEVGRVRDIFGDELAVVTAPINGIIIYSTSVPPIQPEEMLFSVGALD